MSKRPGVRFALVVVAWKRSASDQVIFRLDSVAEGPAVTPEEFLREIFP